MLREDSAHELGQGLARFFEDKCAGRVQPGELEAGAQGRNPDLADGCVGADDKPGFLGLFEEQLELIALAFDFEAVLITEGEEAAAERVEGGVAVFAEELFVHEGFRVQQGHVGHKAADDCETWLRALQVEILSGKAGIFDRASWSDGRGQQRVYKESGSKLRHSQVYS